MPRSVVTKTSSGPGAGRPSTPRSVRSKAERGQVEEGVVAGVGLARRAAAARVPPVPRARPGSKRRIAVGIGDRLAEDVVVDGDEPDLDVGDRLGGRQRADDDVDAVIAGERGEAEIGDDEPLRRERRRIRRCRLAGLAVMT